MGIFKRGRPSRQEPPDKPGIYYFRNKLTKKVDYVGETKSLKRRKKEYIASQKLDLEVHWFEFKKADGRSTSRTRRQHERLKIERHKSRLNQRRGGGGRPAQ